MVGSRTVSVPVITPVPDRALTWSVDWHLNGETANKRRLEMRASITLTEEKNIPTIHIDFSLKSIPLEYRAAWTYLGYLQEEHLYQLLEAYRSTDEQFPHDHRFHRLELRS
jgi:hypothetical protein